MKRSGSSARGRFTRPPPSSTTGASFVLWVSAHAGPAVETSADFTCCADHPGCRWTSSAAAPATCGVAMLVPSKTANCEPANSGSVEERICPPGAATSGLSRCPKSVGPADEKLVTIPLRPFSMSSASRPIRTFARPPVVARYARSRAPSRSEIIPDGSDSWSGIGFGFPERLSISTIPIAPAAWTRADFVTKAQRPRRTRAIAPSRE